MTDESVSSTSIFPDDVTFSLTINTPLFERASLKKVVKKILVDRHSPIKYIIHFIIKEMMVQYYSI